MDVAGGPVVTTEQGRVRGHADDGAFAFLGVPFAADPFGEHRLLAPAPAPSWDGIRDASHYGATAPQTPGLMPGGIPEPLVPGTDCLSLNIFTPDVGAAGLPVLVWIHGGGFVAGCSASPWYRGTRFARDGVVLVSIGYRLGAEGFLHLDDAPANRAVLDWLAALQWVQRNIAGFGGDPAAVTIGGQSAGAAACTTLLSLPSAPDLFRGVIAASGVARAGSLDVARELTASVAADLGVAPTRAAIAAIPPDRLVEAAHRAMGGSDPGGAMSGGGQMWMPVLDGEVVPAKPVPAMRAGAGHDLPVLVGATREEALGIVAETSAVAEDALLPVLAALGAGADRAAAYRAAHADKGPSGVWAQALTDRLFRLPAQRLADARAEAEAATYVYDFAWRAPDLDVGAAHCVDLPFAFDNLDAEDVAAMAGAAPPQSLADEVHGAWVAFVKTGDAGFTPYDPRRRTTMVFDTPSGTVDDPLAAARAAFSRT